MPGPTPSSGFRSWMSQSAPGGGHRGLTRPNEPSPVGRDWEVINACGPVAVALLDLGRAPQPSDSELWSRLIWRVIHTEGGTADWASAWRYLEPEPSMQIGAAMFDDWESITRLADALLAKFTVSGADATAQLEPLKYHRGITEASGAETRIGPTSPARGNVEPSTCPREDLNLHAL
jgi:hypothetical protein